MIVPEQTQINLRLIDQDFISEVFEDEIAIYFLNLGDTHILDRAAYELVCQLQQSQKNHVDLIPLFPEGIEVLDQYVQALTNIGIIQQR